MVPFYQLRRGVDETKKGNYIGGAIWIGTPLLAEAGGIFLGKALSYSRLMTGGTKQWLRLGTSYSVEGQYATYGLRWGASPRWVKSIKSLKFRDWNRTLRGKKIPQS